MGVEATKSVPHKTILPRNTAGEKPFPKEAISLFVIQLHDKKGGDR